MNNSERLLEANKSAKVRQALLKKFGNDPLYKAVIVAPNKTEGKSPKAVGRCTRSQCCKAIH